MFASKDTLLTRPSGGYSIARSVRLRSSASAYLNRTFGSGSRTTWTLSMWLKRGAFSASNSSDLFTINNGTTDATYFVIAIRETDKLRIEGYNTIFRETTQVLRDVSAWYHLVVTADTTNGTAGNRIKMYLNGAEITAFSTSNNPTSSQSLGVNQAATHKLGSLTSTYFDGYLTEINFIDGQALTPSSFGETDSITGVWKPKAYSGTYGTNGFELNFSDNSNNTAATIGKDYSGNGNNWTPNNISVTSGATYDSMTDVPTLTSATAANYAVLNPLTYGYTSGTLSNGNLNFSGGVFSTYGATIAFPSSGKFYLEFQITSTPQNNTNECVGFCITTSMSSIYAAYASNGQYADSGTWSSFGNAWSVNDIIGIAVSVDTSEVSYYKNGTQQGTTKSFNFSANNYVASARCNNGTTTTYVANFGQRPFSYTPPTGFVALNTYNLPASTITNGAAYMAATTYTGTGATASISNSNNGVSFQPDLVWVKSRTSVDWNILFDSVRGTGKSIYSNDTTAEVTNAGSGYVSAFNSNGYSVTAGGSGITNVNGSGNNYVGWQWKAGTTSSSNTNGSITSTVSVGATQGFSVVTYTGNGVANATIGHGLGVTPQMVIVKQRNSGNDWPVYHASLSSPNNLWLDLTVSASTYTGRFNYAGFSSSVFSVSSQGEANGNTSTYVAYCFAAVAGYSAFGSYTGNGSADGPFIYTGFRPRWVMIKGSSFVSPWQIHDSSRNPYNVVNANLSANTSDAEGSYDILDYVSNGFKLRNTGANLNSSGATLIYMAFAENPFKNSLAR